MDMINTLQARHAELATERRGRQERAIQDDMAFAGAIGELDSTIKTLQARRTQLANDRAARQQQAASDDASYAGALGELERTIEQSIVAEAHDTAQEAHDHGEHPTS